MSKPSDDTSASTASVSPPAGEGSFATRPSAAGAAAASTAPTLAVHLDSLFLRLESGRKSSRFPFIRSSALFSGSLAFYLVLALFTFSLYTTVFLLGHSLARVAAHIAAFGIAVSGVIVLLNSTTAATARKIPLPALQLDAVAVGAFFNSLGCAAVALLETANLVLSWREPASSVRCLAYVWLLATFSSMFAPEWLVLYASLATAIILAYLANQPLLDGVFTTGLLPHAKKATATTDKVIALVAAFIHLNQAACIVASIAAAALGFYYFHASISFFLLFTLAAALLATRDALYAVAGEEAKAGGATSGPLVD